MSPTPTGRLTRLALSRSLLDRAAHRREEPGLLEKLLDDEATAVVVLDGPLALARAEAQLAVLTPAAARAVVAASGVVTVFLGEGPDARAWVALLRPAVAALTGPDGAVVAPVPPAVPAGLGEVRWVGLRDLGETLDDLEVAAMTTAVALAAWHLAHPYCSLCGSPTVTGRAGWTRHCPGCGRDAFPRTDPAVIMSVVDDDGRLLLGRQAAWPPGRFSTLAGFVEPGESLEAAVRREVMEEAGVSVGEVSYLGSQPWPFPCSLMLGFTATALDTRIAVDGVELDDARWWSRAALAADLASGTLRLPPPLSIARQLIEQWYGEPLDADVEGWR